MAYYDPYTHRYVGGEPADSHPASYQRMQPAGPPQPRMPMADEEVLPGEETLLRTQQQADQASLSQAERNQLQQYQAGMASVQRDVQAGSLSPDEGGQLLQQLSDAARPLWVRASHLPMYLNRLRYQQLQHEQAQQQVIDAQNARFQALTAQQRMGTVTTADGSVMNTFQTGPGQFQLLPSTAQAPRLTPQLRNTILTQLRRRLDDVNRQRWENPMSPAEQDRWIREQFAQTLELIGLGGSAAPAQPPAEAPPPNPGAQLGAFLDSVNPFGRPGGQPGSGSPPSELPSDAGDGGGSGATSAEENGPPLTAISYVRGRGARPEINPQAVPLASSPDLQTWLERLSRHGDLPELYGPSGRVQPDIQAALGLLRQHGRRAAMPVAQRRQLDTLLRRLGVPTPPENPNAWVAPPTPHDTTLAGRMAAQADGPGF